MRWMHGIALGLVVVCVNKGIIFQSCETGKPFGRTSADLEDDMKNQIATYRMNAAKRALYRRTRDEIVGMSRREALELGIYPEDADLIARTAVWG